MKEVVVEKEAEGSNEEVTAKKNYLKDNEILGFGNDINDDDDVEESTDAIDSFCGDCDLYRDQRDRIIFRSMTIVFILLEIILGTACFAVEVGWEIGSSYVHYYDRHLNETDVHHMVTRTRLLYTTVTIFPFILLPLILIALDITKKFCTFSLMGLLAGFIGFVTFVACGVIAAFSTNLPNIHIQAFQGFAGLAIGTGILFGIHAGCEIWKYICNPVYHKG